MVVATPRLPFRCAIPWESRQWQPWERFLFGALGRKKNLLALTALALMMPIAIAVLPALPLISLALLSAPPRPGGPYSVGIADVLRRFAVTTGTEDMLRLRVFYPSLPPPPLKWHERLRLSGASSSSAWLPDGEAGVRYANAHPEALPLPKRMRRRIAPFLGWFLRFAKLPQGVSRGAPAARAPSPAGKWPLVVFSHGLYGCSAGYSGLCAELASQGCVVLAVEHKDGSAVYSETRDDERLAFLPGADRDAQMSRRVAEMRAVLSRASEVASDAGVIPGNVDTSKVTLVGHSFGAATALKTAAMLRASSEGAEVRGECEPTVAGVVAFDPWIAGYNYSVDGVAAAPTLGVMTQSMMYPDNEERIGAVLRTVATGAGPRGGAWSSVARAQPETGGKPASLAAPVLYVEATETRHQEVSDYPSLSYLPLRLVCMAGHRRPHAAHQQQTRLAVGFLAAVGALPDNDSPQLSRDAALASSLMLAPRADPPGTSYLVHGAGVPSAFEEPLRRWLQPPDSVRNLVA